MSGQVTSSGLEVETQVAVRRPWVPCPVALQRWARAAHAAARRAPGGERALRRAAVCIRVVGTAESRVLNRRFRGKDRPTNVLSFPASPAERDLAGALGDVVVCAAVVAAEARQQHKAPEAHWAHMIVHGVLHLHGHDHLARGEAAAMERLEVEILRGFGYLDPYRPATPAKT